MKYRILNSGTEVELIQYVKDYKEKYPETQLLIGTDSQNRKRKTVYAIVLGLYRPGKGAHVLYTRLEVPRIRDGNTRLLNEVWYSIEVAEKLKDEVGLKAKFIDIDINEDKHFKSNAVLTSALGLVKGMGYEVRHKNNPVGDSPLMCYAADNLVK